MDTKYENIAYGSPGTSLAEITGLSVRHGNAVFDMMPFWNSVTRLSGKVAGSNMVWTLAVEPGQDNATRSIKYKTTQAAVIPSLSSPFQVSLAS
jgi:hypothetical protein